MYLSPTIGENVISADKGGVTNVAFGIAILVGSTGNNHSFGSSRLYSLLIYECHYARQRNGF